MTGTEVVLHGCSDADIEQAKILFLRFAGDRVLDTTKYGQVLARRTRSSPARIYINGVRVAEEANFLFSYNITSLTQTMRKALNRERVNVGRSAYTERVKAVLTSSFAGPIIDDLIADLRQLGYGEPHDELRWNDVAVHASKLANASCKVVFVTPEELQWDTALVGYARSDGYEIVVIPESLSHAIAGQRDYEGQPLRDLGEFGRLWNESFEFQFVDPDALEPGERFVFDKTQDIEDLVGRPKGVKEILISETMRAGARGSEALGLWVRSEGRIIVKRSQLRSLTAYAGTLLHELAHARSLAPDVSAAFEDQLTRFLGTVGTIATET